MGRRHDQMIQKTEATKIKIQDIAIVMQLHSQLAETERVARIASVYIAWHSVPLPLRISYTIRGTYWPYFQDEAKSQYAGSFVRVFQIFYCVIFYITTQKVPLCNISVAM